MAKRPLVDPKSFDLAEHFLQDVHHTEDDKWELAADIQRAVEGWFDLNQREEKR